MKFLRSCHIRFTSQFFGFESTKVIVLPFESYFRHPRAFFKRNAPDTGGIRSTWSSNISHVFGMRSLAQIFPSIIRWISILMVYAFCWPLSSLICPYNYVRPYQFALESHCDTTVFIRNRMSSYLTNLSPIRIYFLPPEFASIRVVREIVSYLGWIYILHRRILNLPVSLVKVSLA